MSALAYHTHIAARPAPSQAKAPAFSDKYPNIIPMPFAHPPLRNGLPAALSPELARWKTAPVAAPFPPKVEAVAGVFLIKARAAVCISALSQPTEGAGWPALLPPALLLELRAA